MQEEERKLQQWQTQHQFLVSPQSLQAEWTTLYKQEIWGRVEKSRQNQHKSCSVHWDWVDKYVWRCRSLNPCEHVFALTVKPIQQVGQVVRVGVVALAQVLYWGIRGGVQQNGGESGGSRGKGKWLLESMGQQGVMILVSPPRFQSLYQQYYKDLLTESPSMILALLLLYQV